MQTLESVKYQIQEEDIHVIPNFGSEHFTSRYCWCQPVQDSELSNVVIHHQDH